VKGGATQTPATPGARATAALALVAAGLAGAPAVFGGANAAAAATPAAVVFVRGGDLYTIRVDGSRRRRLTRTAVREGGPAPSPDGSRIAYVVDRGRGSEIVVADADLRRPRRVVPGPAHNYSPAWSPDGRRIAFASDRSGNYELYVVGADGRGLRRLTRLGRSGYGSYSPSWAPDGRRLVFASNGPHPREPRAVPDRRRRLRPEAAHVHRRRRRPSRRRRDARLVARWPGDCLYQQSHRGRRPLDDASRRKRAAASVRLAWPRRVGATLRARRPLDRLRVPHPLRQ
jgi:WD40-like Beta Propeller Repeat